jgi:uncharacterized protein YqgC (DUF456 family)
LIGAAETALLLAAIAGVAGTVLPLVPGIELTLGAALVYAWWSHFTVLNGVDLAVLAVIDVLAFGADFLLGLGGARRYGAGRAGMVGSVIGLFIGVFILGPIGIIAGPVIGAAVGELLYGRHWRSALRAGFGAGVGTILAMIVRLLASLIMLAYIVWQVIRG